MNTNLSQNEITMTPKEIVSELDKYIVGQNAAKRAVAIALRNRWRRQQVDEKLRPEITPKNILMIGPTGVGKTEIARRLANLAQAPFIKVEATKFTEVGYVGRDVESMIRELMDKAVKMTRDQAIQKVQARAKERAEERILDLLIPKITTASPSEVNEPETEKETVSEQKDKETATRQLFRKKLHDGELDNKEIEIELAVHSNIEIVGPPGMGEVVDQIQHMMESLASKRVKPRRVKVKDALKQLQEDEAGKLVNEDEIRSRALYSVEQNGIIFLDEIDKITSRSQRGGADVSREGVQRDLLPIIEGSTVVTKYGMVRTDHILFIASGAFHLSKPSDLIPELQGRFPIRVELNALNTEDFVRILTEPDASLTEQYQALLKTEGFELTFSEDALLRIAEIAQQVNTRAENIGARRLHTILERLLEEISFSATDRVGEVLKIDREYVNKQLNKLAEDEDLSRSIL